MKELIQVILAMPALGILSEPDPRNGDQYLMYENSLRTLGLLLPYNLDSKNFIRHLNANNVPIESFSDLFLLKNYYLKFASVLLKLPDTFDAIIRNQGKTPSIEIFMPVLVNLLPDDESSLAALETSLIKINNIAAFLDDYYRRENPEKKFPRIGDIACYSQNLLVATTYKLQLIRAQQDPTNEKNKKIIEDDANAEKKELYENIAREVDESLCGIPDLKKACEEYEKELKDIIKIESINAGLIPKDDPKPEKIIDSYITDYRSQNNQVTSKINKYPELKDAVNKLIAQQELYPILNKKNATRDQKLEEFSRKFEAYVENKTLEPKTSAARKFLQKVIWVLSKVSPLNFEKFYEKHWKTSTDKFTNAVKNTNGLFAHSNEKKEKVDEKPQPKKGPMSSRKGG